MAAKLRALVRCRLRCRWLFVVVTLLVAVAVAAPDAGSGGDTSSRSTFQAQCAACHGTHGKGDGWRAWLFRLRIRDFTEPAYVATLSDDYLFQIIKQGGASLGKPGMPSWGLELSDREIKDLIAYIRSLAAPAQPSKSSS